jgi:hypothetical protein
MLLSLPGEIIQPQRPNRLAEVYGWLEPISRLEWVCARRVARVGVNNKGVRFGGDRVICKDTNISTDCMCLFL